jgi:hypothetical protein
MDAPLTTFVEELHQSGEHDSGEPAAVKQLKSGGYGPAVCDALR